MLIVLVTILVLLVLALVHSMDSKLYETYRDDMCILDTSLIHDPWVNEMFKVQRLKKCKHMYGDTITMHSLKQYEISYISPHKRIVALFAKTDENGLKVTELSDYVEQNQLSVVDVWVRTAIEMDVAKVIFASTLPDINIQIRYTTNPISKSGVYCLLIDLKDQVLEYARTTPSTMLTYDKMDHDKSQYFIPFHETSMVDVASIFGIKSKDGKLAKCLSFTYCVWSLDTANYRAPVKQDEGLDKVGFFDQFFKVSKHLIAQADERYSSRAKDFAPLKKMEQNTLIFKENDYMIINAKEQLPKGYVWVPKGDGVYENAFPVMFQEEDNTNLEVAQVDEDKIIVSLNNVPSPYYLVYFKDLKMMGRIIKRDSMNVASVLLEGKDSDKNMYLPKYQCTTNRKYEFDFQCKEENGDVWDRPCMNDFECPFYNMDIYRGGCKPNGYCELPIGVEPVGFRKHDRNTKPFCNDCPDKINDPYCCKDNGDYSFPKNEP